MENNHKEIDLYDERRYEERQDALQDIDRQVQGVALCPNCGKETRHVIWCKCDMNFAGCPDCMTFSESKHNYFCGPDCSKLNTF
jgi:hypothetical protein